MAFPFVSICTPTFNRRPFFPMIKKCFLNQDYPMDRMEWIIVDDGTDPIKDLVEDIPQVKYFRYDEKMPLGKKRNLMHEKASGDILVYFDDDDYYPSERVIHAVTMLSESSDALCAGSSIMYFYFKHVEKMYQFGPYGPKHATAATFAFKRALLDVTRYDDTRAVAEERQFLKGYTIPFVQLDPLKTILVCSHVHNSFDKKSMLDNFGKDSHIKETSVQLQDFIKEPEILRFFTHDIDDLLAAYDPGKPENKPDVLQQMDVLRQERTNMIMKQQQKQQQQQQFQEKKIEEQGIMLQRVFQENKELREKISYLEKKITGLIQENIKERRGK